MILSELTVHYLRNLQSLKIQLSPKLNFIVGPNGSGKTSILEALYILSCGHSFRSREIEPLITHEQSVMTIFSKSLSGETLSVQKSGQSSTVIKINGQVCKTTSELAYTLPSTVIYSDVFEIINSGPAVRRSVLDWGLFHVKHSYLPLLKEYKKVLKQRNSLLKSKAIYQHFIPWDLQLANLAAQIDEMRSWYFEQFMEIFETVRPLITDAQCKIDYYKGWDRRKSEKPLFDILKDQFESDLQRQYTQSGAHQADWIISAAEHQAKQVLSRGQQKMILYAIKFAQAKLLNSNVLYLFDDFAAELDESHLTRLFQYIDTVQGQFVFTSTQIKDEWISQLSSPQVIQL